MMPIFAVVIDRSVSALSDRDFQFVWLMIYEQSRAVREFDAYFLMSMSPNLGDDFPLKQLSCFPALFL